LIYFDLKFLIKKYFYQNNDRRSNIKSRSICSQPSRISNWFTWQMCLIKLILNISTWALKPSWWSRVCSSRLSWMFLQRSSYFRFLMYHFITVSDSELLQLNTEIHAFMRDLLCVIRKFEQYRIAIRLILIFNIFSWSF